MRTVSWAIGITALLVCACAPAAPPSPSAMPRMSLTVGNGTTLTVTLVVNGAPVQTFAPDSPGLVTSPALPPLP